MLTLDPVTFSIIIEPELILAAAQPAPAADGDGLAALLTQLQGLSARLNTLSAVVAELDERLTPFEAAPAAAVLARQPVFLDLETTGTRKTDAIVEAAVVDAAGRVLFSSLVNPQRPIPAEAAAVHGVTNANVAGAPTWEQVQPLLRQALQGKPVVIFTAFEKKFIPAEWALEYVDAKKLADDVFGKPDRYEYGLGSLAARLTQCGLRPGPEHTAAGDCLSTLRLVKYLAGDHSPVELVY